MRKITKIRRSVKAISPVISVLLMIAIAVAASLVAYAWVSGYMDFTTTKVGKSIQIQSVATNAVYIQNIGDSDVEIVDLYVDGTLESWSSISVEGVSTQTVGVGETATIWLNSPLPRTGNQATIKIVTSDGISAEYKETFSSISSNPTQTNYAVSFVLGTGGVSMNPAAGAHQLGGSVAISATPATDYVFNQWISTGSISFANAASASTTATINGAGTITATFTYDAQTYAVDFVLGTGGASMNPAAGNHNLGGDISVSATPATDYVFDQWTSTGSITFADDASASTTATISGAGTITATFTYDAQTYAVDFVMGTGGSSVTPADGNYAGDVQINAVADTNYVFNEWQSNTGDITFTDANSASTTATINGAGTITATFDVIPTATAQINPLSIDYGDGDDQEGTQISNGITAMQVSDDSDYVSVDLTNNLIDYVAEFDFTGIGSGVSTSDVTQITIDLESCYDLTTTQTIYIYNFDTDAWDQIDQRSMGTSDELLTLDITSDASNYVDTDGTIEIKINAPCDGTPSDYHRHRVDFFEITITYTT